MMKPKLLNIILIVLMLTTPVFAASLEELQELAVTNRKVIEAYKLNIEKAHDSQNIARSGYFPRLDVSYSINNLDENSVSEADENSIFYGALSWNLFSGFKDKYTIESAKVMRQIERLKLKGIKQDVKFDVSMRYLAIFNAQARLAVSADAHNTLSKIYADANSRFKVGIIKKNDLLKIKVDLDNAQIDLKKSQAEFQKSIILLERAVDADLVATDINFTELQFLPTLDSKTTCETKMVTNRSEVQALKQMVTAAQLTVKVEKSRLYPTIDFTSSYRKYDDDYINGSGANEDHEIRHQLTASINLFDGFSKYNRINRAKHETTRSRYDLHELISDLKAELKNKFLDLEVSKENIGVAHSSIDQAVENLRITKLTYSEGLSTTSDMLDAITVLSRAKFNHMSAKTEYFANYFTIVRIVEDF